MGLMRKSLVLMILMLAGSVSFLNAQIKYRAESGSPVQLIINTDQIFDTATSLSNPGTMNQGYWSSWTDNAHYQGTFVVGDFYLYQFRGFLTFDLSGLSVPVTSASLRFPSMFWQGMSTFNVRFYDVGTARATLNQLGSAYVPGVFDDLGTGSVYGSHGFSESGSSGSLDVALSPEALADIAAAHGFFSIGAATENAPATVPEPVSTLLVGLAILAGQAALRQRGRGDRGSR